jgi:hypothetical protein
VCNVVLLSISIRWKKEPKVVAKWDAFITKVCNDICVEEVLVHNRPQQCLNSI